MAKLAYGIVSTAQITERMIGAIRQTQHSEPVAVSSRSKAKAEAFARRFGISRSYESEAALFADPQVDIVYIALPNDLHAQAVRDALQAGKHVLCEKPFVLHKEQGEELFALAAEKALFLMEAQKSVFLPTTAWLKARIADGQFGALQRISIESSFAGRIPENHWMNEAHQGGALIPSGSYTLEFLSSLLDAEPETVHALTQRRANGLVEEVLFALRYPKACLASSSISVRTPAENISRFYFEKAQVDVSEHWKARSLLVHHWESGQKETLTFPCDYEMRYEIDHVYECISRGLTRSPVMTAERTLNCVAIVEALQSGKTAEL